jgi:hypothetical protein
MPYKALWAADLTGGGTGAADKIPTAILEDKNAVFVPRLSDLQMYMYAIDDDLGGSEDSPSLIVPDDESGNKRLVILGLTLPNTGLRLLDTNASNYLNIKWNENDTANRTLNLVMGGANRTVTLSGNPTLADWFDQAVKIASSPTHVNLTLTGTLNTKGFKPTLVTKTGNYTAIATDYTILCNATGGSFTITLPAVASHTNRIYNIKKIDSSANTVTVDGNSSETIDDATTAVLTTQHESITIQSDGSEWWII